MKIHFSIEYHTKWGEDIKVMLSQISAKGVRKDMECPLETYDGARWEGEVTFNSRNIDRVEYKYALYSNSKLVWTEWEIAPHIIKIQEGIRNYLVEDIWRPIPDELPLFSSAYTDCAANHDSASKELQVFSHTLQIRTLEPRLRSGEYLAIIGNIQQLGNWQTPVRMSIIALQEWAVNIDASLVYHPIEYKYVIIDENNNIQQWEEGMNRKISSLKTIQKETWIKSDSQPRFRLSNWKCAGIVIPVFSLRTENSYGIGDFGDLKKMIEWAAQTGMHAVQILPINDTTMTGTWMDSYPYNAISIYAFHPIYCDLDALHTLNDKLKMEDFMIRRQELNRLPQLDYEAVFALKSEYLRLIYKQEGEETLASDDFKEFFANNEDWLKPYAAFSYLRDLYKTPVFSEWASCSKYNKQEVEKLCQPGTDAYNAIAYYYYVQYQLHLQLLDVRQTARKNKVIIKGDIPIGISRTSVEAWSEPHYFNLDGQAGAPPDDFSVNGQNWGFPTYNWEEMEKDGYSWWVRRFKKMAEYFDAYRIDHVLGFFRIWEIPTDSVHGLLGQFSPSIPMSVNEIESYGVEFRSEEMTRPYITDETLDEIFGYKKEMVKLLYLNAKEDGKYELKSNFDTQRKIKAFFNGKDDEESAKIREGLYSLVSDVLFIADKRFTTMYHPRISAQQSFIYKSLPENEKRAFNNLYNDYYYNRHNKFWYEEAMKKLPILTQATRMLVCAEDLGMVPQSVSWVMEQLRILSLEIQTMPKAYGMEFGQLQDNPYRSVATISTHDMPTMRMWWEENAERAQRYYNNSLHKDGPAPETLPGWLSEDIINRHLFCPSMLCLLSLQDWLAMDESIRNPNTDEERINIPSNPRHFWRWRMHITVEELMKSKHFNNRVETLIKNSGRY